LSFVNRILVAAQQPVTGPCSESMQRVHVLYRLIAQASKVVRLLSSGMSRGPFWHKGTLLVLFT